jgi:hypothetical protein
MNSIRSPYTRADYYYLATRFQAGKNHVFSELDEEKHKRRRQQLAAGVSPLLIMGQYGRRSFTLRSICLILLRLRYSIPARTILG